MRHDRFGDSYSTTPRYNTKVVVRETGVPADTFRAWERRYGVPIPHRTSSSQRLYSERDIAIIRWLRDRTAEGMTISQAVQVLDEPPDEVTSVSHPADWATFLQQLTDALLNFRAGDAEAVLAEAFAHYSLDDVCLKLIQPALVTIGEQWHAGTVSVGQEHYATNVLRRRLFALLGVYDVSPGMATIVTACAPGEHHDLGLLILSLLLVRRGYRVVYLGADVPLDGLVSVVEQVKAEMVCLSATSDETAVHFGAIADALRALPEPPIVVVGGQGTEVNPAVGGAYTRLSTQGAEAVEHIARLLAGD